MAVAPENGSRKRTVVRGDVSPPTVRGLAGLSGTALRLLRAAGFEAVAIDSIAVEGVVDGFAIHAEAPEGTPLVFFRFIQNRDRTGIAVMHDVRRVMTGRASAGLLITTGSLTAAARSEASRAGSALIDVIDGQRLDELLSETARRRDKPADVLETLTTEILRKRTVDIFPAGYLTVMAIIQGVALGLLLEQLLGVGGVFVSPHPVILISQGIASFLAIVVASYEYSGSRPLCGGRPRSLTRWCRIRSAWLRSSRYCCWTGSSGGGYAQSYCSQLAASRSGIPSGGLHLTCSKIPGPRHSQAVIPIWGIGICCDCCGSSFGRARR